MGLIFNAVIADVIAILAVLVAMLYFYMRYAFTYWERRSFPTIQPSFPFGNFGKVFTQKTSMTGLLSDLYASTTESLLGVYSVFRPVVVLRDPELIRKVMVKDFQSFHDRGVFNDEKTDPLTGNLFLLDGDKWRNLRQKLSPTFTSGKLKAMFSTIVECGQPLQDYLEKFANKNEVMEMREISARFSTNVIASVAFGIETDCIQNPDTAFRRYGRKVFDLNLRNGIRQLVSFLSPKLMVFFKIRAFDKDVQEFMTAVVKQNLEYREKNNVTRKDFFQLLMQLRNGGSVQSDGQWETAFGNELDNKQLSIDEVTAQAFVFYLAGFETTSTTMSFCLYELAKNPEIQQKVHEEIDTVLKKHNGAVTYESVSEMKYLESCIDGKCFLHFDHRSIFKCAFQLQKPSGNILPCRC